MLRIIVTNVGQQSLSNTFGYNFPNDSNTSATDSVNDLGRDGVSFDIREVQLRDDLLSSLVCKSRLRQVHGTNSLSFGGDFFGPFLQDLNEVVPGFLELFFISSREISLQLSVAIRKWDTLSAGEAGEDGRDVTLLLSFSSERRSIGGQESLGIPGAFASTESRALEAL